MKVFFLTIPLVLVASFETMSSSAMPEIKPNTTVTQSTEPKTISDVVAEVRAAVKEIKLEFHPGTTDEEIIFGLQHTIADYRANDADKGKPFAVTEVFLTNGRKTALVNRSGGRYIFSFNT